MTAKFLVLKLLRIGFGYDDISVALHRPPKEVRDLVADIDMDALYAIWRRDAA